jgi:hypothetical protein
LNGRIVGSETCDSLGPGRKQWLPAGSLFGAAMRACTFHSSFSWSTGCFVPIFWRRATELLSGREENGGKFGFADNLPYPSGIFSLAQGFLFDN